MEGARGGVVGRSEGGEEARKGGRMRLRSDVSAKFEGGGGREEERPRDQSVTSEAREGEREWARGAWVGVRVLVEGEEKVQLWEGRGGEKEFEEIEDRGFVDGWHNSSIKLRRSCFF